MPQFQNESLYKNEFNLHENEQVGGIHFPTNGFQRKLVLIQRQMTTRQFLGNGLSSVMRTMELGTDWLANQPLLSLIPAVHWAPLPAAVRERSPGSSPLSKPPFGEERRSDTRERRTDRAKFVTDMCAFAF